MNDELKTKISIGRQLLNLHRVQHDHLYKEEDVDIDEAHRMLADQLEGNLKLAGFNDSREFFAYNNAYTAHEEGDIEARDQILADIAHLND